MNSQSARSRPEFLGLMVVISTLIVLILWRGYGFIHPPCLFHRLTGWPCSTCGGTHAISMLMEGKIAEAFFWNPLVVLTCGAGSLYVLYASGVLFLRLPALRMSFSQRQHTVFRTILLSAAALNWIYLILKYPHRG